MSRRGVNIALGAIFFLGLVLRLVALGYEPPHHPDEFFQYLEPAWRHLTGAGLQTWEWRRGIRSWVLPGYHGAWMALLMRLGIRNGRVIAVILQAHWGLLSLVLVWAGWRGGMVLARRLARVKDEPASSREEPAGETAPIGWQGGLVGALSCAAFPLLVRFSVHTLSELASILCMVPALTLTAELTSSRERAGRSKAALVGVLLGLGICLRIQHGIVPLVALLWLLFARRLRLAVVVCGASLLPILAFGIVDRLTWGGFFASFITYVKFNLIEGGAAGFGTEPWGWYWTQLLHRLPIGLPILGLLCVLGIRASWPFVASALGLALLLSTQAHKEERFVMLFWPLVLIAAAGAAGACLAPRKSLAPPPTPGEGAPSAPHRLRTWLVRCAVLASLGIVFADGARHFRGNDFADLARARLDCQAWVGRQSDATGLLVDQPLYTGGYMWLDRTFPLVRFRPVLLGNPLFSHMLVARDSESMREAERAGFAQVFSKDEFVVLRRGGAAVGVHP